MSVSMTETPLHKCGRIGNFDVYYNPLNHRVICERKTDLATVLFDYPSFTIVRNWDVDGQELTQLHRQLQTEMRSVSFEGADHEDDARLTR